MLIAVSQSFKLKFYYENLRMGTQTQNVTLKAYTTYNKMSSKGFSPGVQLLLCSVAVQPVAEVLFGGVFFRIYFGGTAAYFGTCNVCILHF